MAKKNDTLKKYHFWLLFGLVPLLVLIAVVTVTSSVGGAIETELAKHDKAQKEIASKTNPKPKALIDELEKLKSQVLASKGNLWKLNWDGDPARKLTGQKDLCVWPNSPLLKEVEAKNLKFGDKIPNNDFQYEEFKKPEVYLAEFSTADVKDKSKLAPGAKGMVETIAPTRFNGDWRAVLRHVNAWDERSLTSEQIWLMMEDIWVQRSLLDAVRSVNAKMSAFDRVKYEKDGVVVDDPRDKARQDPLRRKFKSRTWEVELEVANKDNRKVLRGRLKNHTDRLQLMGLGNTMTLKVWLEPDVDAKGNPRPDVRPFEYKIGGEFLPGEGVLKADGKTPANVLDVVETADHILPVTMNVAEIFKIEQSFDLRTVPIRRIEALRLGKTDSRFAGAEMKTPKFKAFEAEAAAAAATAAVDPNATGQPGVPVLPKGGFPTGDPRDPGVGGAAGQTGGGTIDTVITANRKRYVEVTDEVRRMPIAIAVVVDQAYLQDVLLAFANSPLRFQITQVNWARFRGSLSGLGTGGGIAGPQDVVSSGSGNTGQNLSGPIDGDFRGPGGRPGFPGGVRPPGPPRPVGPVPGTPGGTPAFDPYGTGSSSSVSESQLTSGLIELSVYGVVSLYEKYTPPGEAPSADPAAKDKVDPKDKGANEPKEKVAPAVKETPKAKADPKGTPKDKGSKTPKEPVEPVAPEPKTPKMRRRARR